VVLLVYGRGRRKTQLQRDIELLTNYTTRKTKYEEYNRTFKGHNSFLKTDTDVIRHKIKVS